ncbi:T9SS type B sorting domain-containing protein [Maribacter sp. 2210JD10-5]|uniref:T9SS type B sorting domain-containing protein n=1 Tax=Maribacter sp. 2210JD10-5 TaxID=3386272 RepID=UPI0039BD47F8
MKGLFLLFGCYLMVNCAVAQNCPTLISPADGSTNIPVDATIVWNNITGVTGYIISLGTTPEGTDLLNRRSVGSVTNYTPPTGLPENTQIYVTITLFFLGNIPEIVCPAGSFRTADVLTPPACTQLNSPLDGATDVNVATNISWDYAPTATSYEVFLGTSPGGNEIENGLNVGNALSYNPPTDFDFETIIYVTIVPRNENGPATLLCPSTSFTTGEAAVLPSCTSLVSPSNGETNVPLNPILEWTEIPEAEGYRVTIGTSPFNNDILENSVFTTNSTLVTNFEPNRNFFITIVPFNSAGSAIGCQQESFSTVIGCGPFFDPATGELISLNPVIDFPDSIGICLNENSSIITAPDTADGYRWFRINDIGGEELISSTEMVEITEAGNYIYEAYDILTQNGNLIECNSRKEFVVVASEAPVISDARSIPGADGSLRIEITASGMGAYEFALDDINGPYQDSNLFTNVPAGNHTVFVRDKNGCGIEQKNIDQSLSLEGFPKFFTPNGDNANDYWQYIPPVNTGEINFRTIFIFDSFGKLLTQIDPNSRGWNGEFKGSPLPASDYWFKAVANDGNEIKGHFTLKR